MEWGKIHSAQRRERHQREQRKSGLARRQMGDQPAHVYLNHHQQAYEVDVNARARAMPRRRVASRRVFRQEIVGLSTIAVFAAYMG